MNKVILCASVLGLGLTGCGQFDPLSALRPDPAPVAAEAPAEVPAPEIEAPTEEDPEVAPEPAPTPEPIAKPSGPRTLGDVVVALGDPTDQGLWVKTALVSSDTPGRIVTASGATLALTLRPLEAGASGGAQISLPALRELGLPITGLTSVTLVADG